MSLSSSGGERVRWNTGFPAVEAHTEHLVLVRRDGGPIVPPPPDPRDLAGKYGVQAPAKDFEATLLGPNPTPGDSDQVMLSKDRSPRSESICPVERSSSCDTCSNARLAMKGSVQQSLVNQQVDSEHVPVIPGPGSGLMTGTRYRNPVSGTRFHRTLLVNWVLRPHQIHRVYRSHRVIRSYRVIWSDQFFTGQEAQKEKIDKRLDQSELSVLNSPGRSVQLEHNVHKQPGNMPNLQAEHLSEHSEASQGFTKSDSSNVKAYEFPKRTQLPRSGHLPPGIGHTGNPLDIGHTGNRSDQEHGSVRTRHHSDVSLSSRRDSNTRRDTIPLQHADPGEHSPASMIRHRPARNRSRSYDSVSPRRHSRSTSRSRGK